MKLVRFACVVCLALGVKAAAAQQAMDVPTDSAYPSIMEIRPELRSSTPTENPYRSVEDVAQATKPATTLAPPVVRRTETRQPTPPVVVSNGPTVPPEMWLYSEEIRRHDDPAQAVRRKAELRGAQRMSRIAAMKWFGFSNSRPQASPVPMMGEYSPAWIGNGYDRYDWVGVNWPVSTAVRVDNYNYDVRR
jgi:hypothetical protein